MPFNTPAIPPLPLASVTSRPPWGNVTFQLPSLAPYNIHRAQVEVFPKANGCEEFWALNPSGKLTGSECDGVTTGDPYRELRIYINDRFAGFLPIYYTIYTGGVAPMLWSTIVAHTAYLLPSSTFDLGPWLDALNAPATAMSHNTITLEMAGATNHNWDIAGVVLLWRGSRTVVAPGRTVDPQRLMATPSTMCEGTDLTTAGLCSTTLGSQSFSAAGSVTLADGSLLESSVRYELQGYRNVVGYNKTDGTSSYNQSSVHSVSWSSGISSGSSRARSAIESTASIGSKKVKKSAAFLTSNTTYSWQNSGEGVAGGIWVNSFNFTSHSGGRERSQAHYQRLEMLDPTNRALDVPPNITHTIYLHTLDSQDESVPEVLQLATATWGAISPNSSKLILCLDTDHSGCDYVALTV